MEISRFWDSFSLLVFGGMTSGNPADVFLRKGCVKMT